jgi:2'-5' RNA ligase
MPDTGRARLFVALPLPAALREKLAGMAPAAASGIRPQSEADLHLTLHFLGMADIDTVKSALALVTAAAFTATLTLPGQFFSRGQPRTLFVGVAPEAPLRELHAEVGRRLEGAGFALDTRPFVPHITLARLDRTAGADAIAAFLRQALPPGVTHFDCPEFALFASETLPEGARYRVLERYPLASAETAAGA